MRAPEVVKSPTFKIVIVLSDALGAGASGGKFLGLLAVGAICEVEGAVVNEEERMDMPSAGDGSAVRAVSDIVMIVS